MTAAALTATFAVMGAAVAGVAAVGVTVGPLLDRAIRWAPGEDGPGDVSPSIKVAVALANGGLWAAAAVRFGADARLVVYLAFFSTVLVLSVVDLQTYLLPNRVTYPALAVSSVVIVVVSIISLDDPGRAIAQAAGSAVGYAAFLLVCLGLLLVVTGQEAVGLGDVKLAVLLGLHVGWIDPVLVIPAVLLAGVVGLLAGAVAFVARGGESRAYPFGPWLASGAVVAILASGPLERAFGV